MDINWTSVGAVVGTVTGVASLGQRIIEGSMVRAAEKNRRKTELAAKARDHALAIHIALSKWSERWKGVSGMLDQKPLGPALAFASVDEFAEFTTMPPSISERLDKLSEFGDAADDMQRLAFAYSNLINDKNRLHAYVLGNHADEAIIQTERMHFILLLRAMIETVSKASEVVDSLFHEGLSRKGKDR